MSYNIFNAFLRARRRLLQFAARSRDPFSRRHPQRAQQSRPFFRRSPFLAVAQHRPVAEKTVPSKPPATTTVHNIITYA